VINVLPVHVSITQMYNLSECLTPRFCLDIRLLAMPVLIFLSAIVIRNISRLYCYAVAY
jgi:hypothetical protein